MSVPRNTPGPDPAPSDDPPFQVVRFDAIHEPDPNHAPMLVNSRAPRSGRGDPMELATPGWDRPGAIEALDALHGNGTRVEAVQAVRTICGHAEYVLQQWRFQPSPGEPDSLAGEHSHTMAEEFITGFSDPGDGTVTYVVYTLDETGRLQRAD